MAKGRKKIPDAVKEARGTARPDRASSTDVSQSDAALEYIDWSDENPRTYFDAIKSSLSEIGLDSNSYSLLVSATAQRCADLAMARNARNERGLLIESTNVQGESLLRRNPADSAIGEAFKDIRSALTEFRLTPSKIGQTLKQNTEEGFGAL